MPSDTAFMAKAIALAKKGLYSTQPNPHVGCVIVKEGNIVGQGWHQKAGTAHAEIHALADAGDKAQGATAYVSLEPCSHHGRTPPCAEALIQAGIERVVYAMQDPNPKVAGRGLQLLKDAGIEVDGPLLDADAKALNPAFIYAMQQGRPLVISKQAASLDGRTAMASGESQWITGDAARADVQKLRAQSDAIITGIGTVLADNPQLSVRDERLSVNGELRQPLKVVLDSRLRIPLSAAILTSPCLIVHAFDYAEKQEKLAEMGVECVKLADAKGKIDLHALMALLAQRQCHQVLLEAGAKLNGAFLTQGLIQQLWLYLAPTLLGSTARPLMTLELESMSEQYPLKLSEMRAIGGDIRLKLSTEV